MAFAASFDIAVVGLGAMGSAVLYQLGKRGMRAVGIDRFSPPHDRGSSHGETRVTRRANGEGEIYGPLAIRSHEIWRDIEAETGAELLVECGALIIAPIDDAVRRPGRTGFLQRTTDIARHFGIAHEVLDAAEVRHRYPLFLVGDHELAYFEPGGGYLRPEHCIAAQLARARELGTEVRLGTVVRSVEQQGHSVRIATDGGDLVVGQAVIAAGAWAPRLLGPPFDRLLEPSRQVAHWFEVAQDTLSVWRRSPVFSWPHGPAADDFFYGVPCLPGRRAVKTGKALSDAPVDPDDFERSVEPSEAARFHDRHLAGRLAGVTSHVINSTTCLYTVTPDSGFIIDCNAEADCILVLSPCSGHGFKHSAAIGEAVAQLVCAGRSTIDLSAFSTARFADFGE